MSVIKTVNDNLYLLKYTDDYGLDELLEKGVSNVGELIRFVQNRFSLPENSVKIEEGEFACTSFNSFTKDGDHILGRNFDYKDAPSIVVWTTPENGYKSIAVTDTNVILYGDKHQNLKNSTSPDRLLAAPYTCMDGINEKGLAIAVLEIKTAATKQETGRKPIITTVMIRTVLDKCATIDEAIEMFMQFDMHDSLFCNYHYHICDKNGNSVIIEYVNNEMRLIYPEDKRQTCANFYLSPDGDTKKAFGYTRIRWVNEAFAKYGDTLEEDEAMKILQKVRLYYKHKRGYMITSLWSNVYNCNKCSMLLCARMNYGKKFKFTVDCPF